MNTVLITGSSGFIAGHLVRAARQRGAKRVIGVDTRPSANSGFDETHIADLSEPLAAFQLLRRIEPDMVYHLAGVSSGTDQAIHLSNVSTTECVLSALRVLAPRARVVLMGSAAEYGNVGPADQPVEERLAGVPTTSYGSSKRKVTKLAERASAEFGQFVLVARPFNVVGAGMPQGLVAGAIASRIRLALAGSGPRRIRIGRIDSIRDFINVDDVVAGLLSMASSGASGNAYNICSGEGHAISEVLDIFLSFAGQSIPVERDKTLTRTGEVEMMVGSWRKANRDLGWKPTISFRDSLRSVWEASREPSERHS